MDNETFFDTFDMLISSSGIVVDRPRGTDHPRYPDFIYPLDYGYLQGTRSGDSDGIDVWIGSLSEKRVTGVIVCVDLLKRDSECKVLIACTHEEMQAIVAVHQKGAQSALLIERSKITDLP